MGAEATATAPVLDLEGLPVPRRVAIAGLLGELVRAERELAALCGALAGRLSPPALAAALGTLAAEKRARWPLVAALAAAAGVAVPDGPTPVPRIPPGRGAWFPALFEGERTIEAAYRELLALLEDPARCPVLPELMAGAARHRERLRALYLAYS